MISGLSVKQMGRNMMGRTRMKAAALLVSVWLLTGCAAAVVVAGLVGVGVGTYTYTKGELIRSYQAEFNETLQVCIDVLGDLNQPIIKQVTDGEKTTIQTERKDGTYQAITVSIISVELTQVSVRTGTFGYWKKGISQQFHEFIFERLKK
jgi:hypothetical protein